MLLNVAMENTQRIQSERKRESESEAAFTRSEREPTIHQGTLQLQYTMLFQVSLLLFLGLFLSRHRVNAALSVLS